MNKKKYYLDSNDNRIRYFFSKYESENGLICNQKSKFFWGSEEDTVCRFCGHKVFESNLSKNSYIIPGILGNRFLFSKYVCNKCSSKFDIYEKELSNFLSFIESTFQPRSLYHKKRLKLKEKIPGFILTIDREKIQKKENLGNKKSNERNVNKDSFNPLSIFKIFLKIGLTLISKEEVSLYRTTFTLLQSSKFDNELKRFSLARLYFYRIPDFFYPSPSAFIYRRKKEIKNAQFPMHTILVLFKNYMCQIFLPFNSLDDHLYKGKIDFVLPIAPLILLPDSISYAWKVVDLTSRESKNI